MNHSNTVRKLFLQAFLIGIAVFTYAQLASDNVIDTYLDATEAKKRVYDFAISHQLGQIFVFESQSKFPVASSSLNTYFDALKAVTEFIGGTTSIDWTNSYVDDAIDFGALSGAVKSAGIALTRMPSKYLGSSITNPIFFNVSSNNGISISKKFNTLLLLTREGLSHQWIYAAIEPSFNAEIFLSNGQRGYYGANELMGSRDNHTLMLSKNLDVTVDNDRFSSNKRNNFDDSLIEAIDVGSTSMDDSNSPGNRGVIFNVNQSRKFIDSERVGYVNFDKAAAINSEFPVSLGTGATFTDYIMFDDVCSPLEERLSNTSVFSISLAMPMSDLRSTTGVKAGCLFDHLRNDAFTVGLSKDALVTSKNPSTATRMIVEISGDVLNSDTSEPDIVQGRLSWREISIE